MKTSAPARDRTLRGKAAVVGRADMRGDIPVAFVLATATLPAAERGQLPERVAAACRSRLAGFKVPQQVFVIDEMPRAALEKINKAELRRRLAPLPAASA